MAKVASGVSPVRILLFFLLACVLAGGAWYWRTQVLGFGDELEASVSMDVDVVMQRITLQRSESGKTAWTMQATSAAWSREKGVIRVISPEIVFTPGTPESPGKAVLVSASQGEFNEASGEAYFYEDVAVRSGNILVNAETMTFAGGDAREVLMTGNVSMHGPGMKLTAPRARMNIETGAVLAEGGVRSRFTPGRR